VTRSPIAVFASVFSLKIRGCGSVRMGMGIENPFDHEVPLAHEGKQGVGRRRGRRSRLFVIVEYRIDKRSPSGARIRDHILHAATARLEKGVNLGFADKMAGDRWRLDVAVHASCSRRDGESSLTSSVAAGLSARWACRASHHARMRVPLATSGALSPWRKTVRKDRQSRSPECIRCLRCRRRRR
jgi:hypothetical protein